MFWQRVDTRVDSPDCGTRSIPRHSLLLRDDCTIDPAATGEPGRVGGELSRNTWLVPHSLYLSQEQYTGEQS